MNLQLALNAESVSDRVRETVQGEEPRGSLLLVEGNGSVGKNVTVLIFNSKRLLLLDSHGCGFQRAIRRQVLLSMDSHKK